MLITTKIHILGRPQVFFYYPLQDFYSRILKQKKKFLIIKNHAGRNFSINYVTKKKYIKIISYVNVNYMYIYLKLPFILMRKLLLNEK